MSTELTIALILIGVAIIVVSGYFIYLALKKNDSDTPPGPSPSKNKIVISENGSSIEPINKSTTESYIESPRLKCLANDASDRPTFCNTIKIDTGMDYVYDPTGYTLLPEGIMKTNFNENKYQCGDGGTDCIYEDIFDASGNTVVGIKNSNGEDYVEKLKDGIWSGTINLNEKITSDTNEEMTMSEILLKVVEYDEKTGILYLKETLNNGTESKYQVVPGPGIDETKFQESNKIEVSAGMMIFYILLYYYVNGLAKPEIEIKINIGKRFGEEWTEKYNTPSQ